ncbi:hypothetical protein BJV77DRAFT_992369 [Russula vinacea]|nr:hypothetical protein BJV77DRAFT_992369 [Russula vinacea]
MNLHQTSSVGLWLQRGLLQFLLSIIFSIATRWAHQTGLIGSDVKFQDASGLMIPARQSFYFPLSVVNSQILGKKEKIKRVIIARSDQQCVLHDRPCT